MKITKAVNRMYWRFGGNGNKYPFPVNEEDVEALKSITKYVEQKEQEQYEDHEPFAKLFIYLYMKVLQNDKSTVLEPHGRRKIYNLLRKPLFQIIDDFAAMLNESEQYELLESVQGKISHPATLSDKDRVIYQERLKEAIKQPENKSKLLGEAWPTEFVEECLKAEVNQAIEFMRNENR